MSRTVVRAETETGVHDGRPYLLWLPDAPPPVAGDGDPPRRRLAKENHADFGRACAASGWAALAYDQRGHGESRRRDGPRGARRRRPDGALPGAREGVDAERVCVRGSSMGGFIAIHAAATSDAIAGVIAICPAGEEHLLRGLRAGTLEMRQRPDAATALEAWLGEHDLREAVELMGAKPLLLIHARGDERIPERVVGGALRAGGRAAQADPAAGRPPPLGPARRRAPGGRAAVAGAKPGLGLAG